MSRLLFVICLGGCAQAGKGDLTGRPDGAITLGDSRTSPDAFVVPVDAPPGVTTKTLTETSTDVLVANNSIACNNQAATEPALATKANSYYRVFDLAAAGITTDFHVMSMGFQVESSDGQVATARVGTYNGTVTPATTTLSVGNMTMVASNTNVTIPATSTGATVTAPFSNATIPAGKKLYIELDSPDGTATMNYMFVGSNTGGESLPGYILSTACSISNPTNISTVSSTNPKVNMLMTVTGTY